MTEFIGTVVVLALGVAFGYGLSWIIAYHMMDSEFGKKMVKKWASRIMDISWEFAEEEMPKMQERIEKIISESIPKNE